MASNSWKYFSNLIILRINENSFLQVQKHLLLDLVPVEKKFIVKDKTVPIQIVNLYAYEMEEIYTNSEVYTLKHISVNLIAVQICINVFEFFNKKDHLCGNTIDEQFLNYPSN